MSSFRVVSAVALTVASWSLGCGGAAPSAPAAASPVAGQRVLGTIDGEEIRQSDLSAELQARLGELTSEHQQRMLHLLWVGLEEQVAARLLAKEAAARNLSIDELVAQEVTAKVEPPNDEEVRRIYDANAEDFGAAFETVSPHIVRELTRQRTSERRQAFVDSLRAAANVAMSLPVPNLPRVQMELDDAPAVGPKDAPVTVLELADYECPYCVRAKATLSELRAMYPGKIRFVYRDFPLAQHPNARPAAEAAHCAHEQERFWDYHDILFDNSRELGRDKLREYAAQINLDMPTFEACLASSRPAAAVRASEAAGRRMGVEGTPAIYINGIELIGLLPLPVLQAIVEHELERT